MYLNQNKIKFSIILVVFLLFGLGVRGENGADIYKERVQLNFGRSTYIAGERIWFKAFCLSNHDDPFNSLSKVVYIELVNYKSQHVIGQLLEMKDGQSSSCLQLPDTLSSGLYYIKAYTNWMKNFSENKFFSSPVYIYNNYDENNHSETVYYTIQSDPEIYIPGGNLIHNFHTKMYVYEPGLFGRETVAYLIETPGNDSIVNKVYFNSSGLAVIDINPVKGISYSIVYGDSLQQPVTIKLPDVRQYANFIDVVGANNESLTLKIIHESTATKGLVLKIIQNLKTINKISLEDESQSSNIKVPLTGIDNSKFEVRLVNNYGEVLARQFFFLSTNAGVRINLPDKEIKSNDAKLLELTLHDAGIYGNGSFSIDIHKKEPSINADIKDLIYTDFDSKYIVEKQGGNLCSLIPIISGSSDRQGRNIENTFTVPKHPVEDLGILYTGKIISQSDKEIPANSEVILSILDTIPDMQSSRINEDGSFVFLIDKYQNMETYIDLKQDATLISNGFSVKLKDKFFYSSNHRPSDEYDQFSDEEFSNNIKEETKRVIIQRAFGQLNPESLDSLLRKPYSQSGFYGDPVLVVYPGEFFFLPNFGEIIREIVPRVRFKNSNSQCELIVSHIENGVKSNTPLVILDGIRVDNLCDLQLLNSDHIQRIEVQSGFRVAGNYLYNGMVAIYTTTDYKMQNEQKSYKNTYPVPGYAISPDFSELIKKAVSTGTKLPDFENQLYWNPDISLTDNEKTKIEFLTSDELGEYEIEITGFTEDGIQIRHKETFSVVQ